MNPNSFATAKSAAAKLKMKMKMLPAGFSVALCNTAFQSCDRHSNRSFLLLRIAVFVVDAVDVVDVSVSESVAFPPDEHLAFPGITHVLCIIVSSLIFVLHKVFLSFSEPSEESLAESSDEFFFSFLHQSAKIPQMLS